MTHRVEVSVKNIFWVINLFAMFVLFSQLSFAQEKKVKDANNLEDSKEIDSIIDETDIEEDDQATKKTKQKTKSAFSNTKSDKTNIDFEETLLEGKMKAPAGTFLQGRKEQRKDQMVQLRPNFRRELKKSKGGSRSLTD